MLLDVLVQASAKKESIEVLGEERLKIRVKEPREDEKANKRVIKILGDYYCKNVKLIRGKHSKRKIFLID